MIFIGRILSPWNHLFDFPGQIFSFSLCFSIFYTHHRCVGSVMVSHLEREIPSSNSGQVRYVHSHTNTLGKGKNLSLLYWLNSKADWNILPQGGNQSRRKKSLNSKTILERDGVRLYLPRYVFTAMAEVHIVSLLH